MPNVRLVVTLSLMLGTIAAMARAQQPANRNPPIHQTPSPGVLAPLQPGIARQLLTPQRTDAQLAALLASEGASTYTVYSFELGSSMDYAHRRQWVGLLLMPRTADLGTLTEVTVEYPGSPTLSERLYRHADGTWSMLVLNQVGEAVGVVSANGGASRLVLDLDDDGVVDFLHAITMEGEEVVATSLSEGAAMLERWERGEDPLCDPRTVRDRADRPNLLGQPGTFAMCADRPAQGGLVPRLAQGRPAAPADPLGRACQGSGGPRMGGLEGGLGPRTLGAGQTGAAAAGATSDYSVRQRKALIASFMLYLSLMAEERSVPKPEEVAVDAEEGDVEEDDEEADAADAPPGARDRPGIDTDTGQQALAQVCAMRSRSARRWAVTIEELGEQSVGATDTDCEDPVTDPAAADAAKTVPKCGPTRERESVTEEMMGLLGAYRDRQCGPTERPGPDGDCRGGRTLPDGTGRLWYGYGDVIGLIPCEGTACDPAENP